MFLNEKKLMKFISFFLWRGQESNLRPPGYEPDELPLLYPAMFYVCKGKDLF